MSADRRSAVIFCLSAVPSLILACVSCGGFPRAVTVEFYIENGYRFSQAERDTIETIANTAIPDVRRFLPALPKELVLKVYPGTDVIPETGEAGSIAATDRVFWVVDFHRSEGVISIAMRELRGTLFHELHHLVRSQTEQPVTLMQRVIAEGLATVFERDAAGISPPWGHYPPNITEWIKELQGLPADSKTDEWMSGHSDGRRWIGYKAGTYITERAMKESGKSAAELVNVPAAEVLRLAGF